MTLQDAKDQVAKKHGYKDWKDMVKTLKYTPNFRMDQAAEVYAKAKWEESAVLTEIEMIDVINKTADKLDSKVLKVFAEYFTKKPMPKPVFRPE